MLSALTLGRHLRAQAPIGPPHEQSAACIVHALVSSLLDVGRHDVGKLLDYLASVARLQEVFFLWRPTLRDAKDDMVLELAVAAEASSIVTHNLRDFEGAATFNVAVVTPRTYLMNHGLDQ